MAPRLSSGDENPLTGNPKLESLLAKVGGVTCEKDFLKWKKSFLKVYTYYLDPDGILNAQDANGRLLLQLDALSKRCHKVMDLMEDRNIHADQITAEGRRAVTNLSDELGKAEQAISDFLPKTSADEEKFGYDKFELGAILIQDGFYGYDLMMQTLEFVQFIVQHDDLQGLADNGNFQQIFRYFQTSIDVFVQVMEDLGLFRIMKQCVNVVYKGKERKPPKAPEPNGADTLLHKTTTTTTKTTKKIKKKKGQDSGKNDTSAGSTDDGSDSEDGTNKGKSTKNKKGRKEGSNAGSSGGFRPTSSEFGEQENPEDPAQEEEEQEEQDENQGEGGEAEVLYYFDPKTNAIGMIDRKKCGAKSTLVIDLEQVGTDAYQNLVEDEKERQEIIWLLKKLERTKPKEESWLEQIKREKAAKKGESYVQKKDGRKMPSSSSSSGGKRRTSNQSISSNSGSSNDATRRDVSAKDPAGPGFRDPFGATSSSSSKPKKKTVENYQGKYKMAAPKPESGGWKKVS